MLEVFFDGSCIPNDRSGIPCYAFIIKKDGDMIHSDYGPAGTPNSENATNSVAEYIALIKSLEWLKESGYASVPEGEINSPLFLTEASDEKLQNMVIKGDSRLVINQVSGKFKVRTAHIRPLHKKAMSLIVKFKNLKIMWVPREENAEADRLTNTAYREAKRDIQRL